MVDGSTIDPFSQKIKKNKKNAKFGGGKRISFFPPSYYPKSKDAEQPSVFTIKG
jgi:hypothetical protein